MDPIISLWVSWKECSEGSKITANFTTLFLIQTDVLLLVEL
jgi:hypothetical protein